jgi:hypothetical protein
MLSHTLTQTLVRWIVDLNFGVDVAAPVLTREFRIEESNLTMPDVSLMIQSGYTPRKEWIERHFRVELEDKSKEEAATEESVKYDAQKDQDLFGAIFGGTTPEGGATTPTGGEEEAAAQDLEKAADVMEIPEGATPEESQADIDLPDYNLDDLLGEEEQPTKPFGKQIISEDEAVEMDRK